ncbi:MAG: DMT family transporter [Proteobacteria bacterium]|nr:DMT family transporter [Pseudomonadota bacterium]
MESNHLKHRSIRPYTLGLLGILSFSLSFPATKIAVSELSPWFVVAMRSLIAGILGLFWLIPNRKQVIANFDALKIPTLVQVAGVVLGFPILSSIALKSAGSSHGALVIAITPILTAIFSAILMKRSRSRLFWSCGILATIVTLMTVYWNADLTLQNADALLLLAAILVSIGYAFGGKATSVIGGPIAISMAVSAVLPVSTLGVIVFWPDHVPSPASILSVSYLGSVSMFFGFILWYEGLSQGPAEQISLLQSFQLFFTYIAGYYILGENLSLAQLVPSVLVVALIFLSKFAK